MRGRDGVRLEWFDEFWAAAIFWALLERSRWSTVVLGVGALSVAVMIYRMFQIWTVQAG